MVWSNISNTEWVPDTYTIEFWLLPKVDYLLVVLFFFFLTFARIIAQKYFLEYAKKHKIQKNLKFSESAWKSLFYIVSFSWGIFLVWQHNWFPQTLNMWKEYPNPIDSDLRLFYLFELGFYFHSLYAHLVMEVARSDWWALFGHHIVTVLLIYFSYICRFHAVGLLVLVCHDINDIFLEQGKVLSYVGSELGKNVAFVLFFVSWMLTRLGIFPYYIIRSTLFETKQVLGEVQFYHFFNGSLIFLFLLHVYWFRMMVKLLVRLLFHGNELTDTREEGNDD